MSKMKLLPCLLLIAAVLPLAAQDNNWCTDHNWHNSGMVSHSEVRQETIAATAQILVDAAANGSIRVHGGGNSQVQVKACVQTSAHDEASALALARQVTVTDGPGRAVAKGPMSSDGNSWWSVSYDVWVPSSSSVDLHANNGSIHVEGTSGKVSAHTSNGSLSLKDVIGDVDGETTNGSLNIELASGNSAQTNGLKLRTTNGSINVHLPANIGAEVEASTVNGSVKNDFNEDRTIRPNHTAKFTIGSGGPRIDAETVNGSVHILRQS